MCSNFHAEYFIFICNFLCGSASACASVSVEKEKRERERERKKIN
jgi:hypothetical protein